MADDAIMKCDGTDPIHIPDWEPIVGERTLENGGRVGDLLTITRAHIEDAKEKGELREEDAGAAYSNAILESMKSAIAFELAYSKSQLEVCFLRAQIDKLKCDCENDTLKTASQISLNLAQESKLKCDCDNDKIRTENDTKKTASQIKLNDQQIEKLICDCKNDTDKTDSQISLNAAQENKLACDCCNASANTAADVEYRMQQIEKSKCDCSNSSLIAGRQAKLYERQAEGFNDNANQKLYDSQLSAWSMVFADTDLDVVTASINETNITHSYERVAARLEVGSPNHLH